MAAPLSSLDTIEQYPWWSGMFNQFGVDGPGLMLVHDADNRYHEAPRGWRLVTIERQEPTLCSFLGGICAQGTQCVLGAAEAFWYEQEQGARA